MQAYLSRYGENVGITFWLLFVLKFAAFCFLSIWLIPKVTRYFLRRYSDAVMQFIYVLAVMFLSAALSEAIGVEGIVAKAIHDAQRQIMLTIFLF